MVAMKTLLQRCHGLLRLEPSGNVITLQSARDVAESFSIWPEVGHSGPFDAAGKVQRVVQSPLRSFATTPTLTATGRRSRIYILH